MEEELEQYLLDPSVIVENKIKRLQNKSVKVKPWHELEKEYDQTKHPVRTDPDYVEKNSKEKLTRITLGWQKLAVKRMSAMLCGIPVKRVYNTTDDKEKEAAKIIESIYDRNRINSVNRDRAKRVYASCECVTIWYTQETDAFYAGHKSNFKLRCKNYSPMTGAELYPLFDEYDDMIALSVRYQRNVIADGKETQHTFFDTYTSNRHLSWNITTQEEILNEEINILKIPGVYIVRDEPVWENESDNVYEAEWSYSRNGNYIRRNSRPTIVLAVDGKVKTGDAPKGDNVSRDVIRVGKGETASYLTWNQSIESLKFHTSEIKQNFNSQLQLPDTSMDSMKQSPMSGESRKMLFIDAQMKVTDESDIWLEAYDREFNIIRAFAKMMFPEYSDAFGTLSVDHIITPYQIREEMDTVNTFSTAAGGPIASKRTCIKRLGWVDDVDEELKQIQEESAEDVFSPVM